MMGSWNIKDNQFYLVFCYSSQNSWCLSIINLPQWTFSLHNSWRSSFADTTNGYTNLSDSKIKIPFSRNSTCCTLFILLYLKRKWKCHPSYYNWPFRPVDLLDFGTDFITSLSCNTNVLSRKSPLSITLMSFCARLIGSFL